MYKVTKYIIDNKYQCSECLEYKDILEFYKRKNRPNGIRSNCKLCCKRRYDKLQYQPQMIGTKFCGKCAIRKPITEFFAQRISKDGRAGECKSCTNTRKVINLHNNINTRIKENLRNRMRGALYGTIKIGRTMELIGCTIDEFKSYIASKWIDNMSWQNYGKNGWHIDHIKPCSSFDLLLESEQRKCFHYSNLQPLWEKDNLIKGDRI